MRETAAAAQLTDDRSPVTYKVVGDRHVTVVGCGRRVVFFK